MEAVFNISLPTSWAELSDERLLMIYSLFSRDLSAAEVKTLCLMKWNHLEVLATLPRHRFIIKRGKEQVVLGVRQVQQATSILDFLDSFAPMPVRISRIGKYRALPADYEKVPFEKWFSRKYYSSVLNLRDFLADNIGQSFIGVVAKALDDNYRRYNH